MLTYVALRRQRCPLQIRPEVISADVLSVPQKWISADGFPRKNFFKWICISNSASIQQRTSHNKLPKFVVLFDEPEVCRSNRSSLISPESGDHLSSPHSKSLSVRRCASRHSCPSLLPGSITVLYVFVVIFQSSIDLLLVLFDNHTFIRTHWLSVNFIS